MAFSKAAPSIGGWGLVLRRIIRFLIVDDDADYRIAVNVNYKLT